MSASINLSLISPSGFGNYGACPKKLVLDTEFPETGRSSSPQADFGTVCHYLTQFLLGVAPKKEPSEETMASAKRCKEFKGWNEHQFNDHLLVCAQKAIATLPTLPAKVQWVSEVKGYNNKYLPERINRNNEKVGFGGDVDLLASDRSILIDLKFKGELDPEITTEYLWQLAGYHLIMNVPITGIAVITRDSKMSGLAIIDWNSPGMPELARDIAGFLDFADNASFKKYAWPVRGPQCKFCRHVPPNYWNPNNTNKCSLWKVPEIVKNLELSISKESIQFMDDLKRDASETPLL